MTDTNPQKINKLYLFVVLATTIIFPIISIFIECVVKENSPVSFEMIGKWFIFYAVGIRLFTAGIKQIVTPAFTAKEIFHIQEESAFVIVKELGFANACFGLIGIMSLFLPQWRIVSAFGSGLYYGFAALQHFIKKTAGANEMIALVSDVFVFVMLLIYVIKMF